MSTSLQDGSDDARKRRPSPSRGRLTDAAVQRLRPAADDGYQIRDEALPGFLIKVGRRRKVFRLQIETRHGDKRRTHSFRLGEWPYTKANEARASALEIVARHKRGEPLSEPKRPKAELTLQDAWELFERHQRALLAAGKNSKRTLEWYGIMYRRHLAPFSRETMRALADDPQRAVDRHRQITVSAGPVVANATLKLLRTIHRHAALSDPTLSKDWHPARTVVFNPTEPCQRAMPFSYFPDWAKQLEAIRERAPIRAAYHMMNLLTGSRPEALTRSKWEDLDLKGRTLTLRKTKTKIDVVVPLSIQMVRELRCARNAARVLHPESPYIFPADFKAGHIVEHKQDRTAPEGSSIAPLAYWGYELRRTYRTVMRALGIDEQSEHILMGHSARNVNQGYVVRALLVGTSLRAIQRRVSRRIASLLSG